MDLLREEMRRVLKFLEWHTGWWTEHAAQKEDREKGFQEGFSAYAYRQASIRRRMKASFEELWHLVNEWVTLGDVTGKDNEE